MSTSLVELLNHDHSCVNLKRCKKHIALYPGALSDSKGAVRTHLNKLLTKYDSEVNGVILGFQNLKTINRHKPIFEDIPHVLVDVEADFFVFRPEVGSTLSGVVKKKNEDCIICLVHDTFNVTIPINSENPRNKTKFEDISVGQQIIFTVEFVDFTNSLPYIRGKLDSVQGKSSLSLDSATSLEHKKTKKQKSRYDSLSSVAKVSKTDTEFEHTSDPVDMEIYNSEDAGMDAPGISPKGLASILKKRNATVCDSTPPKRISFYGDNKFSDIVVSADDFSNVSPKKKRKKKLSSSLSLQNLEVCEGTMSDNDDSTVNFGNKLKTKDESLTSDNIGEEEKKKRKKKKENPNEILPEDHDHYNIYEENKVKSIEDEKDIKNVDVFLFDKGEMKGMKKKKKKDVNYVETVNLNDVNNDEAVKLIDPKDQDHYNIYEENKVKSIEDENDIQNVDVFLSDKGQMKGRKKKKKKDVNYDETVNLNDVNYDEAVNFIDPNSKDTFDEGKKQKTKIKRPLKIHERDFMQRPQESEDLHLHIPKMDVEFEAIGDNKITFKGSVGVNPDILPKKKRKRGDSECASGTSELLNELNVNLSPAVKKKKKSKTEINKVNEDIQTDNFEDNFLDKPKKKSKQKKIKDTDNFVVHKDSIGEEFVSPSYLETPTIEEKLKSNLIGDKPHSSQPIGQAARTKNKRGKFVETNVSSSDGEKKLVSPKKNVDTISSHFKKVPSANSTVISVQSPLRTKGTQSPSELSDCSFELPSPITKSEGMERISEPEIVTSTQIVVGDSPTRLQKGKKKNQSLEPDNLNTRRKEKKEKKMKPNVKENNTSIIAERQIPENSVKGTHPMNLNFECLMGDSVSNKSVQQSNSDSNNARDCVPDGKKSKKTKLSKKNMNTKNIAKSKPGTHKIDLKSSESDSSPANIVALGKTKILEKADSSDKNLPEIANEVHADKMLSQLKSTPKEESDLDSCDSDLPSNFKHHLKNPNKIADVVPSPFLNQRMKSVQKEITSPSDPKEESDVDSSDSDLPSNSKHHLKNPKKIADVVPSAFLDHKMKSLQKEITPPSDPKEESDVDSSDSDLPSNLKHRLKNPKKIADVVPSALDQEMKSLQEKEITPPSSEKESNSSKLMPNAPEIASTKNVKSKRDRKVSNCDQGLENTKGLLEKIDLDSVILQGASTQSISKKEKETRGTKASHSNVDGAENSAGIVEKLKIGPIVSEVSISQPPKKEKTKRAKKASHESDEGAKNSEDNLGKLKIGPIISEGTASQSISKKPKTKRERKVSHSNDKVAENTDDILEKLKVDRIVAQGAPSESASQKQKKKKEKKTSACDPYIVEDTSSAAKSSDGEKNEIAQFDSKPGIALTVSSKLKSRKEKKNKGEPETVDKKAQDLGSPATTVEKLLQAKLSALKFSSDKQKESKKENVKGSKSKSTTISLQKLTKNVEDKVKLSKVNSAQNVASKEKSLKKSEQIDISELDMSSFTNELLKHI